MSGDTVGCETGSQVEMGWIWGAKEGKLWMNMLVILGFLKRVLWLHGYIEQGDRCSLPWEGDTFPVR